jgi:hypothetical protein
MLPSPANRFLHEKGHILPDFASLRRVSPDFTQQCDGSATPLLKAGRPAMAAARAEPFDEKGEQ